MSRKRVGEAALLASDELVVSATEFKATCLELIDTVGQHQFEVVVTKHGKPVAKLVPYDGPPTSGFGWLRETVADYGNILDPIPKEWIEDSAEDPLTNDVR